MCVFSENPAPGYAGGPSVNTPMTGSTAGKSWASRIVCSRRTTAQSRFRLSCSLPFSGNFTLAA
ncbi:MAG: hypothetical protein ABIZ80_23070 [Bryobacteraceae bacterium]